MNNKTRLVLAAAAFHAVGGISLAQNSSQGSGTVDQAVSDADDRDKETFTWSLAGGDIFQFDSGIKNGGSYSVNRFFLGGGLAYKITPALTLDFNITSEIDSYTFKGNGDFTAPADGVPWTTTIDVSLRGLARWKLDDHWRIFLGGVLEWAGETRAEVGKSFTGGGLMGVAYTFSEDLTLGGGLQISTRIEDDLLYIPSPIIDWRITEQLFISNVRGPVSYPASLGVEIVYYLSREMNVSIGSRYEYRRFRLDDSGPTIIQQGVGTDSGFPVWLRFEWRPVPEIRLHLVGGVVFGQKLQLDTSDGTQIQKQDIDPAAFVGFFLGFDF